MKALEFDGPDERAALKTELISMRQTIQQMQTLQMQGNDHVPPPSNPQHPTAAPAAALPPGDQMQQQQLSEHKQHSTPPSAHAKVQKGALPEQSDIVAPTTTTVGLGLAKRVIEAIVPFGPADLVGSFRVGDTVIEVNGTLVTDDNVKDLLVGNDVAGTRVNFKTISPLGEVFEHEVVRAERANIMQMTAASHYLAELLEALKSDIPGGDKVHLLASFGKVEAQLRAVCVQHYQDKASFQMTIEPTAGDASSEEDDENSKRGVLEEQERIEAKIRDTMKGKLEEEIAEEIGLLKDRLRGSQQQLTNTQQQHHMDLVRVDAFSKSEQQRLQDQVDELKKSVAASAWRSASAAEQAEQQDMYRHEISQIQIAHQREIEKILEAHQKEFEHARAKAKETETRFHELHQMHGTEVGQLERMQRELADKQRQQQNEWDLEAESLKRRSSELEHAVFRRMCSATEEKDAVLAMSVVKIVVVYLHVL